MTSEQYKAFGPQPEIKPCPRCQTVGRDTSQDVGLSAALFGRDALWPPVHPLCETCGGLGQVEVVP